jgi:transcriptional regulator with XRE-family HTH domain
MTSIGERIRARRRQLGLTLDQVSVDTQIPKSTIQRWESGAIKNMGQAGLQKLALSLNTTVTWLMTGEETAENLRKMTPNEFLFEYLCKRNHFSLSGDRTSIYREMGSARFSIPIGEETVRDLVNDTVDYFGYLLKKRATLYKNGEPDPEEFIDEVFR